MLEGEYRREYGDAVCQAKARSCTGLCSWAGPESVQDVV